MQDPFRQHFESNFEPLKDNPQVHHVENTNSSAHDIASDSNWSGFSDDEDTVEVIQERDLPSIKTESSREELTSFMVPNKVFKTPTNPI